MALAFFRRNLAGTPEGRKASRLSQEAGPLRGHRRDGFKIGYAMDAWGALVAYLQDEERPGHAAREGRPRPAGEEEGRVLRPVPGPRHLPHLQPDGQGRRLRRPDRHRRRAEIPEFPGHAPVLQGQAALRAEHQQGRHPRGRRGHSRRGLHGLRGPLPGRDRQRRRLPGDRPDPLPGRPGRPVHAPPHRQLRRRLPPARTPAPGPFPSASKKG